MGETYLNKAIRYGYGIKKQPYASLTEEDVDEIARKVEEAEGIDRVESDEREALKSIRISTIIKINSSDAETRMDALYAFQKEYEAQIKDVTQPQGGTENLTNVRSPGQP